MKKSIEEIAGFLPDLLALLGLGAYKVTKAILMRGGVRRGLLKAILRIVSFRTLFIVFSCFFYKCGMLVVVFFIDLLLQEA